MDGHVAASSNDWKFPEQEIGSIIHGVWFGSIEPLNDRYQDPWDNSVSLQATYRDIQIWERSSTADTIKDLYTSNRVPLVRKTKSTKKKSKAANTADSSNTENGRSENEESLEDEDIDDEDLLWADD
jgi:hypothetical protein